MFWGICFPLQNYTDMPTYTGIINISGTSVMQFLDVLQNYRSNNKCVL